MVRAACHPPACGHTLRHARSLRPPPPTTQHARSAPAPAPSPASSPASRCPWPAPRPCSRLLSSARASGSSSPGSGAPRGLGGGVLVAAQPGAVARGQDRELRSPGRRAGAFGFGPASPTFPNTPRASPRSIIWHLGLDPIKWFMCWVLNENGVRSRSSYSTWLRSRARYLVAKGGPAPPPWAGRAAEGCARRCGLRAQHRATGCQRLTLCPPPRPPACQAARCRWAAPPRPTPTPSAARPSRSRPLPCSRAPRSSRCVLAAGRPGMRAPASCCLAAPRHSRLHEPFTTGPQSP
jgi:hypothetical protein